MAGLAVYHVSRRWEGALSSEELHLEEVRVYGHYSNVVSGLFCVIVEIFNNDLTNE
jgi:hypothetical protein